MCRSLSNGELGVARAISSARNVSQTNPSAASWRLQLPPALGPQAQQPLELLDVVAQRRLGRVGQARERRQPGRLGLARPALGQLGPRLLHLDRGRQRREVGGGASAVLPVAPGSRPAPTASPNGTASTARWCCPLARRAPGSAPAARPAPARGSAASRVGACSSSSGCACCQVVGGLLHLLAQLPPDLLVAAAGAPGGHQLALPGGERGDGRQQLIDRAPHAVQGGRCPPARAPAASSARCRTRLLRGDQLHVGPQVLGGQHLVPLGQARRPAPARGRR